MLIMARSLIHSLESTRAEYYQTNHFAEVFGSLKRAPNYLIDRIRDIPGVATAQTDLSVPVTLDLPGITEPASGLVRSLHEPDDLLPAARALAREIADNTAPVSVALTRQLIWRMAGAAHPMEAHRADSRGIQARGRSPDAREGVTSFLEKRPAAYPDKVSSDLPDIWPHWTPPAFL